VWGSDVGSGVDNDPTVYGRPPFSAAGILLNCLFLRDLEAALELGQRLGREDDASSLRAIRERVAAAVNRECWDERDSFYYTVDVQCTDQRDDHVPGDFGK